MSQTSNRAPPEAEAADRVHDDRHVNAAARLRRQFRDELIGDPARLSEVIKDTALFLGASLVGITELNRDWVYRPGWERYSHTEMDLDKMMPASIKYAVVMAIETNYDMVKHAPTARASAAAGLGYSKMAFLAALQAIINEIDQVNS